MSYIVTVKLPRNPAHDPANKVEGPCPFNGSPCTDITGQHHSTVVQSLEHIDAMREAGIHVTRVEEH